MYSKLLEEFNERLDHIIDCRNQLLSMLRPEDLSKDEIVDNLKRINKSIATLEALRDIYNKFEED